MASTKKQIPEFRSEAAERAFWAEHDSTEFIDWQAVQKAPVPESEAFTSHDLPTPARVDDRRSKVLAHKWDVPYQSLLKVFLAERLERERRSNR